MRPGTSGGNNPDSEHDMQYPGQQRYNNPQAALDSSRLSIGGGLTPNPAGSYGGMKDDGGYLAAAITDRRQSDFAGTDDDFAGSMMGGGMAGGSLIGSTSGASYGGEGLGISEVMGEGGRGGPSSEGGTQPTVRMKTEGEEGSETTPVWTETKTKAGKERKRLPLACIMCRRKKIRCSGEKPACKHCVRSRIPCVYKQTARKTTPRTDYMAMLDRRLKRMEERLLKNIPKDEVPAMIATTGRSIVRPSVTTSTKKRAAESTFADESGRTRSWSQFGAASKRRVSAQHGIAPHQQIPGDSQPESSNLTPYKEWFETYPTGVSAEELASLQYLGSHSAGEAQVEAPEEEAQPESSSEFFSKLQQQQSYSRQPSRQLSLSQQQRAYLQQQELGHSPDLHHSPASLHHANSPASLHHTHSPIGPSTSTSMHTTPSPAIQGHLAAQHHPQQRQQAQPHLLQSPPKLDTQTAAALSQAHLQSSPYYTVSHAPLSSPMSARAFPPQYTPHQPPPPSLPPQTIDPQGQNPSQYLYSQPQAQIDLCDWHRNLPSSVSSTNNKCAVCAFIISGLLNRSSHTTF